MRRRATHAGSWYSDDQDQLDKQLDGFLSAVSFDQVDIKPQPPHPSVRAIIAPHAGYRYSGPTAAYAYFCMDPQSIDVVFLLGPSHHVYLKGCALSQCTSYATPLGDLFINRQKLKKTGVFEDMDIDTDEDEHSIEMHLPYLYKIMNKKEKEFTVVPILVGALSPSQEKKYADVLLPYFTNPRYFFIISSDFCHWGSRFRYCYLPPPSSSSSSLSISERVQDLDTEALNHITSVDTSAWQLYLSETKNTICGRHPIGILMYLMEAIKNRVDVKFVKYDQSSRAQNEKDSSVSYASVVVLVKNE